MAVAIEELHEVVTYRGRDVCSCGDFNCASLDVRPRPKPSVQGNMRAVLASVYPGARWARKVRNMSDAQVFAIYNKIKTTNS